MNALVIGGERLQAPDGLTIRTYLEDAALRFLGSPRKAAVNELVIHETVTRDVASTLRILRRRKLGAHFIIAPDGEVLQNADPARTRLEHAAPHNARSVGVEVVNPVEPRFLRKHLPWTRTIPAPWAHGQRYVLPTPAQAEACSKLIELLTLPGFSGVSIPRNWLGLCNGRLTMGRVRGARRPRPGIYAHTYFRHADGAWPVLYAWLRLEAKLSPEVAFERAVELSAHARDGVDLTPLLNQVNHGA